MQGTGGLGRVEELSACRVVQLRPTAPFNFDATLFKPDHFPSGDTAWEPGARWQTMRWRGELVGLKFEDRGTVDRPRVALTIWSQDELAEAFLAGLVAEIEYRYSFGLDLTEFYDRFRDDPDLGPLLVKWRGLRPFNANSLYEYLMIAIVLQNATVRRSVAMLRALFEHYGTLLRYDGRQLYAFWPPETVDRATEDDLRQLRVGYRARSIKRVSAAFAQGEIDEVALRSASGAEQRKALLALYGIGPASVGYILADVFHHLDELDHISPWELKIYSKLFFDRDPETPLTMPELLDFFSQRYPGYRTLAIHYFWEDLFWRRRHERVPWLEALIRL
jgi:3-methyladenine DNA glycosylase/8-oxoguanine DNA glycosylase